MGINQENREFSLDEDKNQPNKVTDDEHNKVQAKVYRQMDILELIKIIEEEEGNGKEPIQGNKA
jgi:hypothetical protein